MNNFVFSFNRKKRIEITKDEENNKVTIKVKNYLCKRKTTELDLANLYFDIERVYKEDGEGGSTTYYRLIFVNTFKDGNTIDLDSSNIQNKPVKIYDYFEPIDVNKFNGQSAMKQTLKTFVGNNCNEEENPLCFNIRKYMEKSDKIVLNGYGFVNRISYSKYAKMNDHFFSYYSQIPFISSENKCCEGCFTNMLVFSFFYLLFIGFISKMLSLDTGMGNNKKNNDEKGEIVFGIGFFAYVLLTIILYFVGIIIASCCNKKIDFLRVDMIYSRYFDRLFIGVVKNDEKEYISKNIFKLDEIDKFVIQKNNINEQGFHLKYITKGNGQIQDIVYINDNESELMGLIYILNEKLTNNINNGINNKDTNIIVTNNIIDKITDGNNMLINDEDAATPFIQP